MATQPHQDAHYVHLIGAYWTVWLPLGDCPMKLGSLALLPGSHRDGLRPHSGAGIVEGGVEVAADAVWSTADLRSGDGILFRSHTLHCSLPNRSGASPSLGRFPLWLLGG